MTRGTMLQTGNHGLIVSVPLKLKKRAGRKEVILPDAFGDADAARLLRLTLLAPDII